ncbi:MAG: hypothetical protein P4M01_10465 [Acidobacteriota bacterium]|nr:hypothetical protein [Acidobacteriota bacterium]
MTIPTEGAKRSSNSRYVRFSVFLFAAVFFGDMAYGSYQDGKSWWKQALAALLWVIAAAVIWWRNLRPGTGTETR